MPSSTDYLENKLIDFLLRGQSFVPPASLYAALFTTSPSDSGGGTEVSGAGYARVAITSGLTAWAGTQGAGTTTVSSGTSSQTSNNAAITFGSPAASWGTVVAAGLIDGPTGGNLWFYSPLTNPKTIAAGDPAPSFAAGGMAYSLDYEASSPFDTTFDSLAAYASWVPITNTTFYTRPAEVEPASKSTGVLAPSYIDQRFGTAVYSVTKIADVGGAITHLRNDYSRHIAFNCDSSRFIAVTSDSYWHLYNAYTFERINGGRTGSNGQNGALLGIQGSDCEPVWHPTNPNKLWYTSDFGGLVWYELDVTTGVSTVLFNLTGRLAALGMGSGSRVSFGSEGRPSNDGRYWAMMVKTAGSGMLGLLMYDRQSDSFMGSVLTSNAPNNITTSPLGNYAVPCWANFTPNSLGESEAEGINSTDGARAYSPDFSSFRQMSNTEQHADVALDALGNEVYCSVNFSSNPKIPDVNEGYTYYRRMDNGVAVQLPLTTYAGGSDTGIHFSGGAYKRPGFLLVNLYGGTPATWKDGCLMAVELKPTGQRVLRLGHHQSSGATYWVDPLACVNSDFTRILYGSDFRRGSTPGVAFMIGLPSNWSDR